MRTFVLSSIPMALACAAACAAQTPSLELHRYVLQTGPLTLPRVYNASGITFGRKTKTLFVVIDAPTEVRELGLDGKTKRVISLKGFEDLEGITHVEGDTFAVVEERRRVLCLIDIGPKTRTVEYGKAVKVPLDRGPGDNKGLEGVAYDPVGRRLFAVKEARPRRIYELARPQAGAVPKITHPWDIEKTPLGMRDLSDLHYHAGTGHLLILSHESACLVECTTNGKEISRLRLVAGSAGLERTPRKPEGVTVDDRGTLYVCGESNWLCIFAKPAAKAADNY